MPRTAVTVSMSLKSGDVARFERLVARFGSGNRAEFLRQAMDRLERAEVLEDLLAFQAYGEQRRHESGRSGESVNDVVQRVGRQMTRDRA